MLWWFCFYLSRMPPLSVFWLLEFAMHEPDNGEFSPALWQCCVWFMPVCALIPWLSIVFAMVFPGGGRPNPPRWAYAMCKLPVNTTAIAEIAAIAVNVLWLIILCFYDRRYRRQIMSLDKKRKAKGRIDVFLDEIWTTIADTPPPRKWIGCRQTGTKNKWFVQECIFPEA